MDGIILLLKQYEHWESFQCYTKIDIDDEHIEQVTLFNMLIIFNVRVLYPYIGLISFPTFPIILADILYFTAVKMACYPTITLCHLDSLHAATASLPLPQPHDVMWKSIAYVTFKHIV